MNCPWCQNKCSEKKDGAYNRYDCRCLGNDNGIKFTAYARSNNEIVSFTITKIINGQCFLQLMYNTNSAQGKLYAHAPLKTPHRLKVIEGHMTPEQASKLLTQYSKLMAFI